MLKRLVLLATILLLLCEGLPTMGQGRAHVRLFQDGDEMFGSGDTYFAVSEKGTLVGWGSNHLNRLGGILPWRPYFARRTIAREVTSFSCGSNTVMYVDGDHVLWGWGTNAHLLLSDGMRTPGEKTPIMRDVREAAVGYELAAAVKTDGSLWTWGRNSGGQLGVAGAAGDEGEYCPPQKVMDHVKTVKIMDGIPFAIAEDDTLYVWGMDRFREPTTVAERVRDAAYLGNGGMYQYLTLDGSVFAFDAGSELTAREHRRVAEAVRSVFYRGMVKDDSTLWSWTCEGGNITPLKERDGVWTALDNNHFITDSGYLSLRGGPVRLPHAVRTIVPVLRDVWLLTAAAYAVTRKRSAAKNRSGIRA